MENIKINLAEINSEVIEDLRSKFLKASQIADSLEKEQVSNLTLFKDMRKKLAYIAAHMTPSAKPSQTDRMMSYFKGLPALQAKIAETTRSQADLMGEFAAVFEPEAAQYFPENKTDLRGYA